MFLSGSLTLGDTDALLVSSREGVIPVRALRFVSISGRTEEVV